LGSTKILYIRTCLWSYEQSMDKSKIVMIAPVTVAAILMLAVLAAISSTNQVFAAEKKTEVTISATQNGPAKTEENNETWVPVTLSGRLTSEGSGVAGATVALYCDDSPCDREPPSGGGRTLAYADTDSGGHYSVGVVLEDHNHKTHKIQAFTQHIPSEGYEYSNETTTIQLR
jgi:hypothetical protein